MRCSANVRYEPKADSLLLSCYSLATQVGKEGGVHDNAHFSGCYTTGLGKRVWRVLPRYRNTPYEKHDGIVSVLPGAPRPESPREFSFVMVWDSLEALKAFVGEDYANPHIDPAEKELVESRSIKHYNLVES